MHSDLTHAVIAAEGRRENKKEKAVSRQKRGLTPPKAETNVGDRKGTRCRYLQTNTAGRDRRNARNEERYTQEVRSERLEKSRRRSSTEQTTPTPHKKHRIHSTKNPGTRVPTERCPRAWPKQRKPLKTRAVTDCESRSVTRGTRKTLDADARSVR